MTPPSDAMSPAKFIETEVPGLAAPDVAKNLFVCDNDEYIQRTHVCDGVLDCRTGGDEYNCCK